MSVRVRARSDLEVRATKRQAGLALTGTLRDDRGRPLARQAVHAEVEGLAPRSLLTGQRGRFELLVGAEDALALAREVGERVEWTLSYEGTASWGPITARGELDLEREPTWLTVEVDPPVASLDRESVAIRVGVHAGDDALGQVPVRVRVADGPELVGESDEDGRVVFLVRPDTLGRAGPLDIQARWEGDLHHAPARAEASLTVLRPTRITLRVGREGGPRTGRYRFSGRLSDDRGAVAGATVALVTRSAGGSGGDDALRTRTVSLTDDQGVFLAAIQARELTAPEPSTIEVRAVHQPSGGVRAPVRSRPARIPVPGPPGVPFAWYLASIAAGMGVILLLVAVRMRFWEEIGAAWARWRRRQRVPAAGPAAAPPLVVADASGEDLRPDWIAGRVVDAHTGRPVPGAAVTLARSGTVAQRLTAERDGAFAAGPLGEGRWTVRLEALGHLERARAVDVPHDGRLDGATFALVSLRSRIRDVFAAALRRFDGSLRWGLDTPAEAARGARSAPPDAVDRLARLRAVVERAWFGPTPPTLDDVREAERLLEEMS
ncbi:MAG: carboxypeptidase regulatory-like domain-containing protein [Myxococcota bacterium]